MTIQDKQQRITSYVSASGLRVYETEQYNKDTDEWYIVGDGSTNKDYILSMIDSHNTRNHTTIDEKRFLRRNLINEWLHSGMVVSLSRIIAYTRRDEVAYYGRAMRIYYP
jgi:hypothetical protein